MRMYWATLLEFWMLVLCVKIYSSNMKISPCRRYMLLLSTVPGRKQRFVSILSFERSFSVKRQCIPYAAPIPCLTLPPFTIFLRNWEQGTCIQSKQIQCHHFYTSLGYQVHAETARSRLWYQAVMPAPSLPLPKNRGIVIKPVYEWSHNRPTIRRMCITIFIRRVIYHYLLPQGKRWNLLSKQGIWSFLCR